MTRAVNAVSALALFALAGCGGSSYENADPDVVQQVDSSSSCSDLQNIADAWDARYQAYPEGDARTEARETFLAASDRLTDLGCPGW